MLEPRLLLLDEPLSALDPQTRREVRGELKRLLTGLPCVTLYVTHSPAEAIVFGDRLAVVAAGRIVAAAAPPTRCSGSRARATSPSSWA